MTSSCDDFHWKKKLLQLDYLLSCEKNSRSEMCVTSVWKLKCAKVIILNERKMHKNLFIAFFFHLSSLRENISEWKKCRQFPACVVHGKILFKCETNKNHSFKNSQFCMHILSRFTYKKVIKFWLFLEKNFSVFLQKFLIETWNRISRKKNL